MQVSFWCHCRDTPSCQLPVCRGPGHGWASPASCTQRDQRRQGLLLAVYCYLLSFSAILEVNGNLNCRCIKTASDYISPKRYESIEIRPVGSTCRRTEIIIKLKTSGKVCVNPEAPWVKKLLKRILVHGAAPLKAFRKKNPTQH
uniref:Chemokine interleukin-8-like domain-containing protein n=1 Tax=Athene cunicularia TaxID=194338 RepID=A0A663ML22_ATHCN